MIGPGKANPRPFAKVFGKGEDNKKGKFIALYRERRGGRRQAAWMEQQFALRK